MWEGHRGKRDSLNLTRQLFLMVLILMVCVWQGMGSLAPLKKTLFSQKAWAELQNEGELFNHQE